MAVVCKEPVQISIIDRSLPLTFCRADFWLEFTSTHSPWGAFPEEKHAKLQHTGDGTKYGRYKFGNTVYKMATNLSRILPKLFMTQAIDLPSPSVGRNILELKKVDPARLPCIFPEAPLKDNSTPGKIHGTLTVLRMKNTVHCKLSNTCVKRWPGCG